MTSEKAKKSPVPVIIGLVAITMLILFFTAIFSRSFPSEPSVLLVKISIHVFLVALWIIIGYEVAIWRGKYQENKGWVKAKLAFIAVIFSLAIPLTNDLDSLGISQRWLFLVAVLIGGILAIGYRRGEKERGRGIVLSLIRQPNI